MRIEQAELLLKNTDEFVNLMCLRNPKFVASETNLTTVGDKRAEDELEWISAVDMKCELNTRLNNTRGAYQGRALDSDCKSGLQLVIT